MYRDDFGSGDGYESLNSFEIIGVSKKSCGADRLISDSPSGYRAMIVTVGHATVACGAESFVISARDVILIPPYRQKMSICSDGLEYISVIFDGREASAVAERYGFRRRAALFKDIKLSTEIKNAISKYEGEALNLCAKGIMQLVFAEIANREMGNNQKHKTQSAAEKTKAYIDEFYASAELSLGSISSALSYHPNYISRAFNEAYGMSIIKYVNVLRVRRARFLMEEGENSLKVISAECGFSDTEYFSAVFKSYLGQKPRDYLKRIRSIGTTPD